MRRSALSTLMTRASTSWPTLRTSLTFSTRSSLICEMWTRPSMSSVELHEGAEGGDLGDRALDEVADLEVAVDVASTDRSSSCFMPRLMRWLALSMSSTMASTSSPFLRTSDGWLILRVQRHVGDVDHAVDAFFEFDEGAVGGHVADLALDAGADRVAVFDLVPRIRLELADAEGDLLLLLVDAEHDGLDFLADREHVGRAGDALGPGELGDVDEAFDALARFRRTRRRARGW